MRRKPQPQPRYRLRNWPEYNTALERRGSITLWLDEAAVAGWVERGRTGRRGAPQTYSEAAIVCMLTLKELFRLPLRATVGFVRSVLTLMGGAAAALPVAHFSTLSRRRRRLAADGRLTLPVTRPTAPLHLVVDTTGLKVYGEGEWTVRQHGWTKRRTWLKVHLGVDAATSELRVLAVSTPDVGDGAMLPALLAEEQSPLAQVTGDGGYDEWRCYDVVAARPEQPRAVFPPPRERRPGQAPRRARRPGTLGGPAAGRRTYRAPKAYRTRIRQHGNCTAPPLARDEHVRAIRRVGRRQWKRDVGYHRRSLAETAVFRLKTLFGDRVSARTFEGQMAQVALRGAALNRMTALGMPDSVRADDA